MSLAQWTIATCFRTGLEPGSAILSAILGRSVTGCDPFWRYEFLRSKGRTTKTPRSVPWSHGSLTGMFGLNHWVVSVERWPCKKCITHYETVKSKEFGGGTATLPEVWSLVFRPRWWGPIHSRSCSEGPGKSRNLTKKFDELNWNLSIPMNELKKGLSRLRLCAVKVEMEKCGAHLAQLPFQTSSGTRHLAFWQDFVAGKTLKNRSQEWSARG